MTPDIELPRPHPGQQGVLDARERFKVLRCGRRWGKSRLALIRAVLGDASSRGMAEGGEWAWVAPDYPQARAIWREEILPRFAGKESLGVTVSETDKRVSLPGGGSLELRSAENVDSLRGRALDGIIFDEAAHLDLQYAWEQVARPALLDRRGSALFISSPNGGRDGNADGIIPSYFNRLCERGLAGTLGEDWGCWHFTTRQNPYLPAETVEQEYRDASPLARQQELDAELIYGGGGLAFPEWRADRHITARWTDETLRDGWRWYAGLDWGYTSPGVYTLFCTGPDERVHVRWDMEFSRSTPEDVARRIVRETRERGFLFPAMIGCDSAMQQRSGVRSVWEAFHEAWADALGAEARQSPLVPVAKTGTDGKGHRESRKLLMHELLAWEALPDGRVPDWMEPRLTFHPEARYCRETFPKLLASPIPGEEDIDTTGPDHGYDSLGYGLWLRPRGIEAPPKDRERHVLQLDDQGQRQGWPKLRPQVAERGYGVLRLRAGRTPETV